MAQPEIAAVARICMCGTLCFALFCLLLLVVVH